MLKRYFQRYLLPTVFAFTTMSAYADEVTHLKNLVTQTKTCHDEDCPTSAEFLKNPKVKKDIQVAFQSQGVKVPDWLFSVNVVSTPAKYVNDGDSSVIKFDLCKPHFCGSDNVTGDYYFKFSGDGVESMFMGDYVKDGATSVAVMPNN